MQWEEKVGYKTEALQAICTGSTIQQCFIENSLEMQEHKGQVLDS